MPVWNTSDADCSKAPFRFQRYCGSREFRGADAVPEQLEHRGLHPPALSPHQSYVFSYMWTGIPDNVWSPLHRGHPVPAKISPNRIHRRSPQFCAGEHPHLYFQVMNPCTSYLDMLWFIGFVFHDSIPHLLISFIKTNPAYCPDRFLL